MSLINDALKRAKQAQDQAPPPPTPGPQLRPVEPAQYARHGVGLLLPAALALVALLALLLVWQLSRNNNPVRALQAGPPPAMAGAVPPAPERRAPALREPADNAAQSGNLGLHERTPEATPAATAAQPVATNPPAPVEVVSPPKPPPLRLQAIVFDPRRPSALISGKTLFLGDRIGAFRLVALNQESATLVSLTETNVLTLP